MPRRRNDETEKGLFSIETGERPFVVRVREAKERGSKMVLDYREPGTKSRRVVLVDPPLRIRDGKGRVDPELVELAKDAGRKRSAELRLGVMERLAHPERLTIGDAFRRYMHPETGGMPKSREPAYRRTRDGWIAFLAKNGGLGGDTPWNRITPADVWGFASQLKEAGKVPSAIERVKALSAV